MNRLRSYLKRTARATVVVHLQSGTSIKGVLYETYADVVVLRHAKAAPNGAAEFTEADGEIAVPRANVDWIQVIAPDDGEST